jgi:hypothetical protein
MCPKRTSQSRADYENAKPLICDVRHSRLLAISKTVHFVKKDTLSCALGRKLKSGRSKADLFDLSSMYEPLCRLTFAEVP